MRRCRCCSPSAVVLETSARGEPAHSIVSSLFSSTLTTHDLSCRTGERGGARGLRGAFRFHCMSCVRCCHASGGSTVSEVTFAEGDELPPLNAIEQALLLLLVAAYVCASRPGESGGRRARSLLT